MGSQFAVSLPLFKVGLACNVALTESYVDATFPLLEISLESNYSHSTVNIDLPLFECNLESLYSHSSFSTDFPLLQSSFKCQFSFSSFIAKLPLLKASFTGISNSFSSFTGILPLFKAVLTATNYTFSAINIIFPKFIVEFVSDGGVVYKCLVLHNEIAFTNWEFANTIDSIVEFDGDIYLASGSGLLLLGSSDDAGIAINATIQTGLDDGGIPLMKQATGYHIGMRSNGVLNLVMNGEDETETDNNTHILKSTSNKIRTRKIQTERNPKGRWLGAKISNIAGADFRIIGISIGSKILYRKDSNNA